jgi:small basic protein
LEEVDVDVVIILKIIFGGIGYEIVDAFNDLSKMFVGSFFVNSTVNQ